MKMYFVKATYTDGIYKLSDFYVGNTYKQVVSKMQDINLEANDGATSTTVNTLLPDGSRVNDYSHVLVPDVNKIYEIDRCVYVNNQQTQIQLIEDSFIGNYQTVKSKKLQIERTNDVSKFVGKLDILNLAETYDVNVEDVYGANNLTTGMWMMLSYQKDAFFTDDVFNKFFSTDIKDSVAMDYVSTSAELKTKYPEIATSSPLLVDYFLKFVRVQTGPDAGLKQCVLRSGKLFWRSVETSNSIIENNKTSINRIAFTPVVTSDGILGDIDTVNVLFPIETGLIIESEIYTYATPVGPSGFETWQGSGPLLNASRIVPSWYHLKEIPPKGLVSVRVVPDNLIDITYTVKTKAPVTHWDHRVIDEDKTRKNEMTYGFGANRKVINKTNNISFYSGVETEILYLPGVNLRKGLVQDILISSKPSSGAQDVKNYEPFKNRYLYMYGELISIPNRIYYEKEIRMRLIIDSTSTIYELYTDDVVVLKSGILPWYTRYQLDKLDIYQANNPTYKEQFWTNQISGAIKGITFGALKGGAGAATAALGSAMNIGASAIQMAQTEEGMRLQADQIMGINNLSLTLMKGFAIYWVVMTPESIALENTKEAYQTQGFPTYFISSISALTAYNSDLFGMNKIVKGQLLETVRNKYTTNEINRKLQEGVILI